jgi:CheY-like chemotaxis protein
MSLAMSKPGQVLIVEDDVQIATVLSEALADEGYEVRGAANGREGLSILETWTPQAIVLDLMMPIMDGRAFRAAQRTLPGHLADLPVIVLSGAHNARAHAEELGAVAVLAKPFDLNEVLDTVARICQTD